MVRVGGCVRASLSVCVCACVCVCVCACVCVGDLYVCLCARARALMFLILNTVHLQDVALFTLVCSDEFKRSQKCEYVQV